MAAEESFADLIRRVRAGDGQAAAELVRRYEADIRREVHARLKDSRLRRAFDSMDVCQSVLGGFFARAAAGAYELDQPEQLLKLLVGIARNKVAQYARKEHAGRRDQRRATALNPEAGDAASPDPTPSRFVAGRELLQELLNRLPEEERRMAQLRTQGSSWAEIAAALGGTEAGRRMQLARALRRVAQDLKIDPHGDV